MWVDGAEDEKGANVSSGREIMSGFTAADVCRSFRVGSGFGGVAPEKFDQLGIAEVDKVGEGCNGIVV